MRQTTDAGILVAAAEEEPTHRISFALLIVAAVSLGLAVRDASGNISSPALAWLSLCVAATLASLAAPRATPGRRGGDFGWLVIMAFCGQFAALLWEPTLLSLDFARFRVCSMLVTTAAVLCGLLLISPPRLPRWVVPALLLIHLTLGCAVISGHPIPGIDVIMFQQQASEALLHGVNPYTIRFADPYPPASSAMFYGEGVSVNGVLQFGYPYLPTTLLLALPGYLAGDVRYASLAAMALAAAFIAYAKPGRGSYVAAAVLLFTPAFPLMVFLGWTDSYVLLLLALVWFCHCRAKWLVPYAAGLLLSSKQYMIVAAPLALLLVHRPWTLRGIVGFGVRMVATGCAVLLPLALWDVRAFWHSAVALQFHQPFRPDALSYFVWLRPADPRKWLLLPFAVVAMVWLVLWRVRGRVTFPSAISLVLLAFFAVNKQAFANYYYLVVGALCVAAADSEGALAARPASTSNCATMAPSRGSGEA